MRRANPRTLEQGRTPGVPIWVADLADRVSNFRSSNLKVTLLQCSFTLFVISTCFESRLRTLTCRS